MLLMMSHKDKLLRCLYLQLLRKVISNFHNNESIFLDFPLAFVIVLIRQNYML